MGAGGRRRCSRGRMSRIRFYLDEDVQSHALVAGLRARAVDVMTTSDAARTETDDDAQLVFASQTGRVIVTSNVLDFPRIHGESLEAGRDHAGIVIVPQQRWPVGEVVRRLLALRDGLSAEAMHNRLEYLSHWQPPIRRAL